MRTWLALVAISLVSARAQAQEPAPSIEQVAAPDDEGTPSPASEVDAPKVALVVVGDPDPALQQGAVDIEAAVGADGSVRVLSDPTLSAALRGVAATEDDGLSDVRRERRRLGLGETSDVPVLQRLGRLAGAALVVAVRRGGAGPEAIAFDVNRGQFFEGALALPAPATGAALFVRQRARIAARSATAPSRAPEGGALTDGVAPGSGDVPATDGPSAPTAALTVEPSEGNEPDWFEQNWPYFAAGALLVGAIVFVVVAATDGGDPPPMLRFQPGAP